jgi:UrcA family protein
MHSVVKCMPRLSLLAAAAGLAFAVSPAMAQGYAYGAPAYGPTEEVIVTAPPILRGEGGNLDVPGRATMSIPVRYDDLNLTSGSGARALRHRVRMAARDVCVQLAAAAPVRQLNGTSCYKTALDNGLVRADAAIRDARLSYYYGYYED